MTDLKNRAEEFLRNLERDVISENDFDNLGILLQQVWEEGWMDAIKVASEKMESAACKNCRFPPPPDACDLHDRTEHSTCMRIIRKARSLKSLPLPEVKDE